MARKQEYGNESITSLKGADRVRKRPAVIFGSDGVEAAPTPSLRSSPTPSMRPATATVTPSTSPAARMAASSSRTLAAVMPVDWNKGEERYNWELLFCEMYAGGKYGEGEDNYEFSSV